MSMFRRLLPVLAMAGLLFGASQAGAAVIGPGVGLTGANLDTQDVRGRINIDPVNSATLGAGIYSVGDFRFDAGSDSTVTPFIAIAGAGADTYEVIAIGATHAVTAGADQSVGFGGGDMFTLAAAMTEIFAGIVTFDAPNPIQFSDGGTTAHDNTLSLTAATFILGVTVDGLSHPDLGRQYNFDIEVNPKVAVPVPSTALLLSVIAVFGMGLRRRRLAVAG